MKKGAQWEITLGLWHRAYAVAGSACVVKAHPEAKVVGGRLIYSGTGPPDFLGTLGGGQAVAFEAKEVQGLRLPFKNIEPHQAAALSRFQRMGAVAFIAVQAMDKDRIVARVFLPWSRVQGPYTDWASKVSRVASIELCEGTPIPEDGWLSLVT